MGHIIEPASSARAKCRACKQSIARGELRFGQREENPYGEGEATYRFHLKCAAAKVPTAYLDALNEIGSVPTEAEARRQLAELASAHRRLSRLGNLSPAPTGRARCRHCKELIAKGEPRLALEVVESGMLEPWGFIHAHCAADYCEGAVLPLIEARGDELDDTVRAHLEGEARP